MRSVSGKLLIISLTGILLLAICWVLQPSGLNLLPEIYQQYAFKVAENQLHQRENYANNYFDELEETADFDQWIEKYKNNPLPDNIHLYIFEDDRLTFWSTKDVIPSYGNTQTWELKRLSNGYYLQKDREYENFNATVLLPVKKQYQLDNEYLQSNWQFPGLPAADLSIHAPGSESGTLINDLSGDPVFAIEGRIGLTDWLEGILVTLALLGYFFLIAYWHFFTGIVFKKDKQVAGISLLALGTVLAVILWQWVSFPDVLFSSNLFSSRYFAVTPWLASFGDLMVLAFMFCWWVYFLVNYIDWGFPSTKTSQFVTSFLFVLPVFIAAWGLEALIRSLVLDSNINLNPTQLFEVTFFSFFSYLLLFLFLLGGFIMSYYLFRVFYFCKLIKAPLKIIIISTSLLVCMLLYAIFENGFGWIFLLPLGFWFIFYSFQKEQQRKALYLRYVVIVILFTSFLVSWRIMFYENERQQENKRLVINRLVDEGDAIFEFHFNRRYQQMKTDPVLAGYFMNPLISSDQINERIENYYFPGHSNQYQIDIYAFTADSALTMTPADISLQSLMNRREQGSAVFEDKLYYIRDAQRTPGYIAFLETTDLLGINGLYIISFRQRTYYEESIYPELLMGKRQLPGDLDREFSFAMYNNGRLTSQQGTFSYPGNIPEAWTSRLPAGFEEDGSHHYIQSFGENTYAVLTQEGRGAFYHLAAFSSVFILFTIFVIFSIFIRGMNLNRSFRIKSFMGLVNPRKKNPLKNMRFGGKVQLTIIIAVMVALIITGIVTTRYIIYDFNHRERQELQEKSRQVLVNLENKAERPDLLSDQELERIVQNLAGTFRIDVNLYDAEGGLISSSQPEIFNRGIVSTKMSPHTYFNLTLNGRSHTVQEEKIGDLTYISSYFPVRNPETGEIRAFLSLPYFGKEADLEHQISTLLATLVNLYLFMFILTGLSSIVISNTLTRPFQLISEKLRKVKLGQPNEPIKWDSDDEIGHLIREYNTMIKQLENSAEKLAENEREMAWREMARQVAHEIKNPLTPMKLSIQKLQMHYKPEDEKSKENFRKTTNLLIHQIENLAKIASEFSNFAKMPVGEPKKLNINEVLRQTIDLYANYNAEFNFYPAEEELFIVADPAQLERVFSNLLGNAMEASDENQQSVINIKTFSEKGQVKIWIEDNGPGVPKEMQSKIFKPNFSTKTRGMGLGLSICRKILNQAGAEIMLDDSYTNGARFVITFGNHKK